ncbi:MAG: DUF4190 domain-containing protein [Planctomycetaceae bacterium]|nr:DUF4190 domain-containing protein [Planctomycetaceae bacterium]
MAKCAFCHCSLEGTQGSLVPSQAMAHAFAQGYSPEMSPSWPTMKETAVKAVTDYEADCSDAALAESWKRQLTLPNRRFRMCDRCFSTLFPYLPADPGELLRSTPQSSFSDDSALKYIVPINTSIWAIFASYAALFSVIVFPAPIALILGIIALIDVRRHPEKKGMVRAIFAIVMGTIFTLLMLALFLFAVITDSIGR